MSEDTFSAVFLILGLRSHVLGALVHVGCGGVLEGNTKGKPKME